MKAQRAEKARATIIRKLITIMRNDGMSSAEIARCTTELHECSLPILTQMLGAFRC